MNPQVVWEGGSVFMLRIANTGLSFLFTLILSRSLGASGYGIFAYAYALAILLAVPAEAGLSTLIVRETALGVTLDRPDLVKGVWRWSERLVLVVSVILMLIAGLLLFLSRSVQANAPALTLAWALVLVPLTALSSLRGAALRGLQKVTAGQLPESLVRPGMFVIFLCIVLVTGRQLSPPLAMALLVFAAILSFVLGAWMLWHNTPEMVRQTEKYTIKKEWLTSAILFALIASFSVINNQASTVILGWFKTSDQVGIYRVAVQVAALASFGLQTVNMIVAPRFADLYARKDMVKLQQMVTLSARIVLAFNLALTLLFILSGRLLFVLLFGSDFEGSYLPLVILLLGQSINSAAGSVGYLLNMTGHEAETTKGLGFAAGVNVVLNIFFIPFWGIYGAALATTVSMVVWNILLWQKVRQRLGINSLAFSRRMKVI
jgi:O-antigen/teichoic acid export membrane protein